MNINTISIVIIAKNAEAYLKRCLDSVSTFDDVIVYLNNSTDNTQTIAQTFKNVTIVDGYFDGFGPTKNRASSCAKNDWVFSLDSDEILTPELFSHLKSLVLNDNCIYQVKRLNHYNEQPVTCCGWGNDKVLRLYNRNNTEYLPKSVHESLAKKNLEIVELKGQLEHYPFNSIKGLIAKADSYSELFARDNYKQSSIFKVVSHSFAMFVKCYFFKKGYKSGYVGFLISYFNAFGTALKYLKLLDNTLSCSLVITTYNRPDALELSLLSALNQSIPPSEIIIADDGSGDETAQLIKKIQNDTEVKIIHAWQEDDGFRASKSRNNAIAKCSSDYVVIVDGDMVLHQHFIKDHLKCATSSTFLQGSRVLMDEGLTEQWLKEKSHHVPTTKKGLSNRLNGYYLPWLSQYICRKKSKKHKGIRSCNMSFFKADAVKINGFNEEFITWGREDSEFAERLFNIGVKRRNLKFRGIQYHLYHSKGAALPKNDLILDNTIKHQLKWCDKGISKHLTAND